MRGKPDPLPGYGILPGLLQLGSPFLLLPLGFRLCAGKLHRGCCGGGGGVLYVYARMCSFSLPTACAILPDKEALVASFWSHNPAMSRL